jgi:hypothetical protein
MALNATTVPMGGGGPKQEPIPVDTYPARVVQVIDLGLQPQEYMGQEKAPRNEVNITYELLDIFIKGEDGQEDLEKPRWVGESFVLNNLKADKAKSTKRILAIDPTKVANGDLTKMVGMPCNVTIAHNISKKNGNVYANVSMVSPASPRRQYPELKNNPKVFELDNPNLEIFLSLPEFLQDKIKSNLEFPGSKLDRMLNGSGNTSTQAAPPEAPRADMSSVDDMDTPPF